jgi:hypothetical protein
LILKETKINLKELKKSVGLLENVNNMKYDHLGQPIPSNINPHYLGVALIILVTFIGFWMLSYIEKKQIHKDCNRAVRYSEDYPLYQPEESLVKVCTELRYKFKP